MSRRRRIAALVPLLWIGGPARQEPLFELRSEAPGDCFGVAVAGGGDVDGDGVPDLIVGAYADMDEMPGLALLGRKDEPPLGLVRICSGKDRRLLHEIEAESDEFAFGTSVAFAGDVDGDGHDDVLVGAPLSARALMNTIALPVAPRKGLAYLYSGSDGAYMASYPDPAPGGGTLAMAVAGIGDVDGDRRADVAVGYAHVTPEPGLVIVYSGRDRSVLLRLEGALEDEFFGLALAKAGDVDGDSAPDVIVGAPSADVAGVRDRGSAKVFSGRMGKLLHAWHGEKEYTSLGSSVAGLGDLDGDGRSELLVGATGLNEPREHAGGAFVYSGKEGKLLFALAAPERSVEFGLATCALGDVNGDGTPDFAVSAGREDTDSGDPTGRTRVFSGKDGALLFGVPGRAAELAGDLDGDGVGELVTGVVDAEGAGVVRVFSIGKALAPRGK